MKEREKGTGTDYAPDALTSRRRLRHTDALSHLQPHLRLLQLHIPPRDPTRSPPPLPPLLVAAAAAPTPSSPDCSGASATPSPFPFSPLLPPPSPRSPRPLPAQVCPPPTVPVRPENRLAMEETGRHTAYGGTNPFASSGEFLRVPRSRYGYFSFLRSPHLSVAAFAFAHRLLRLLHLM